MTDLHVIATTPWHALSVSWSILAYGAVVLALLLANVGYLIASKGKY